MKSLFLTVLMVIAVTSGLVSGVSADPGSATIGDEVQKTVGALTTGAPVDPDQIRRMIGKLFATPSEANTFFALGHIEHRNPRSVYSFDLIVLIEALKRRSVTESAHGRSDRAVPLLSLIVAAMKKVAVQNAPNFVPVSDIPDAPEAPGAMGQQNAINFYAAGIDDLSKGLIALPPAARSRFAGTQRIIDSVPGKIAPLTVRLSAVYSKHAKAFAPRAHAEVLEPDRAAMSALTAVVDQETTLMRSGISALGPQFARDESQFQHETKTVAARVKP